MDSVTVPVSEVYGPVWQGEGPAAGRLCSFLRLGLCDLSCSWCDTPWTWDRSRFDVHAECPPRTAEWITARLAEATPTPGLLVVTGGEPLLHRRNLALLDVLEGWPGEVHVETNGTIHPTQYLQERVTLFAVSPKLGNAGNIRQASTRGLAGFTSLAADGRAYLKVVCQDAADVDEAAALVAEVNWQGQVWVMPEGQTGAEVMGSAARIAQAVLDRGWNLTLRQHVLMYGKERRR